MLTKVEVQSNQGALLSLPIDDPSGGIIIANIDGLGPVKATLVSSSFARLDGEMYQSARRESRNLVFTFDLEPDYSTDTVRDLRNRLYAYFMTKSWVGLTFYDADGLTVTIDGFVESCEPSIFERDTQMVVSIMCFSPDFKSTVPVVTTGSTVSSTVEKIITYDGTVETGVVMTLNVNRTVNEFTIYHYPPDGALRQTDFSLPLLAGDVLTISTIPGAKSVVLKRGTTESSALYGISPQSNWTELMPGSNRLRVYAVGAAIPYTITHTVKYGGL